MSRRQVFFLCFTLLNSAILASPVSAQQTVTHASPLTLEEVVKLTKAGFAEEIVVTKIKKNGKPFDLSTDELLDLKKDGVSDNVIKYLLDPSQPYTPPATPALVSATKPARKFPEDTYASQLPAEPGLFFFSSASAIEVDLKLLLGKEEGKSIMKKGKVIAYLIGAAAKTRLKGKLPASYVHLPDGKEIEELILLSFLPKKDRRELAIGAPGPKQQIDSDQMRQFEAVEVAPRVYRLNPGNLAAGEYLFYFLGSADPAKGVYGKGYDFSVDAPSSAHKK